MSKVKSLLLPDAVRARSAARRGLRDYRSLWLEVIGLPFRQGYAEAGGVRTRYLNAGMDRPRNLILLHGFMSHAEIFMRNLAAHAAHFNTFAIDLVGMGFSDRPAFDYHAPVVARQVRDFMDAMGLETASVLGTSFGSRVAARFAVDYPERLEKLTLIAPSGLYFDPDRGERLIRLHFEDEDESTWDGAYAGINHIVGEQYMFDDIVGARKAVFSQPGVRDVDDHLKVHHLPETAGLSLLDEDGFRSIAAPTLIVQGVSDPLTCTVLANRIQRLIRRSRLVLMQDCNHAPYFEKPDAFNALHLDFLLET
jgi:2-hydroxy-6-oxonona-2,4-dienedioate hydrolase